MGGIVGSFVGVGRGGGGDEVSAVVGESQRLLRSPVSRALAPGICQRDDMVDLDLGAGAGATAEHQQIAGVGVPQMTRYHQAWLSDIDAQLAQPSRQYVIAGITAVAIGIGPGIAEELALVVGQRQRLCDSQPRQRRLSSLDLLAVDGGGCHRSHLGPPARYQRADGHRQQHHDRPGEDGACRRPVCCCHGLSLSGRSADRRWARAAVDRGSSEL